MIVTPWLCHSNEHPNQAPRRLEPDMNELALGKGRAYRPRLAIVAHDGKKADLVAFATFNRDRLQRCELIATGTTGRLLVEKVGLNVECMESDRSAATSRSRVGSLMGGSMRSCSSSILSTSIHTILIFRPFFGFAMSATCRCHQHRHR